MNAVQFGAGNIGRGFVGFLLSSSNYKVTFVDVNKSIVDMINERKSYTVQYANAQQDSFQVTNISALAATDEQAVLEAILRANIVTTAVGVHILPHIAPLIAKGIEQRVSLNLPPLTIVACENAIRASSILKEQVAALLNDKLVSDLASYAVFPDAAVDRIVPTLQHKEDPLLVTVEPFYEWTIERKHWLDDLPLISGVHYVDQLDPYIERKLFTVNTGHCTVAYIGQRFGYTTIQEAMKDSRVVAILKEVLEETGSALVQHYQLDQAEHAAYINQIIERFNNDFFTDDIARVGRSPIRKLSAKERFMRPIELARLHHIKLQALPKVIAAALLFQAEHDTEAMQLKESIVNKGISATITDYTGLLPANPLHAIIVEHYNHFNSGNLQQKGGFKYEDH